MQHFLFFAAQLFTIAVLFVRLLLYFIDRMSNASVSPDAYVLVAWAERILLLLISAFFLYSVFPTVVFGIGFGRAFGPSSQADWALALLVPLGLYVLAAFVLNLPWFPLAWQVRVFRYVQFLLLALLGLIPLGGVALLVPAGLFAGLWWLCLRDRETCGA